MTMAPKAPVITEPTNPLPIETPSFPKIQEPTKLPSIPTTMFPINPKLLPLKIWLPSHPAIAPIINVTIISIIYFLG